MRRREKQSQFLEERHREGCDHRSAPAACLRELEAGRQPATLQRDFGTPPGGRPWWSPARLRGQQLQGQEGPHVSAHMPAISGRSPRRPGEEELSEALAQGQPPAAAPRKEGKSSRALRAHELNWGRDGGKGVNRALGRGCAWGQNAPGGWGGGLRGPCRLHDPFRLRDGGGTRLRLGLYLGGKKHVFV